ncbi:hypothetical protein Hs20B_03260 [Lactococcus insecticola]|uniref:Uncharacterized protein n=1 Tax=Pseudolactococcus insecticola TaxID=2709158 RepID=A0A6A0B5Y7_9LACT|nr:hypothetical protein Hs20B_03260 [Lactococcus insecticola]
MAKGTKYKKAAIASQINEVNPIVKKAVVELENEKTVVAMIKTIF